MKPDEDFQAYVDELLEAFPRLFSGRDTSAIGYPPGWSQILHDLCHRINATLDDVQASGFQVTQVKEKFGLLRFYYTFFGEGKVIVDILGSHPLKLTTSPDYRESFPADTIDRLIAEAEKHSAVTCAVCASPGVLRRQGWWRVTCDRCEAAGWAE